MASSEPESPKKELENQIEEEKMAYVERALYSYFNHMFMGGYKILQQPAYRLYFWIITLTTIWTTLSVVLFQIGVIVSIDLIQMSLFAGLMIAMGFILGGVIGGILKQSWISNFFALGSLVFVGITIWKWDHFDYDSLLIQWFKLIFFLLYIGISTISLFFILLNFHTSKAYRIISWGNSPNRLFFQPIIRLGGLVAIPMYFYLLYQKSFDAQIIGYIGLVFGVIILVMFFKLPVFYKKEDFEISQEKRAWMNFRQVLGFYNFYLIYQLSQSYTTGGNISNLAVDLILLLMNSFYIINSLSRKVDEIEDFDENQKNHFRFQRKNQTLMKLKKSVGEKGSIFIALGIALGYHLVVLDSFTGSPIIFLSTLAGENTPLNVINHRMSLLFALSLISIALINFRLSSEFRAKAVNRYTFRHVIQMFGDLFRPGESGLTPLGEVWNEKVTEMNEKMGEIGKKMKEGWSNFTKGFQKPKNPNANANTNTDPKESPK